MLEVMKKKEEKLHNVNLKEQTPLNFEIITTRYKEQRVYNDDGTVTLKRVPERINITKKVNETKKLIKEEHAKTIEKLAELEKALQK